MNRISNLEVWVNKSFLPFLFSSHLQFILIIIMVPNKPILDKTQIFDQGQLKVK